MTIARFVPIVRTFAPLVAGSAGMDMHRFQFFNVLGALIWVMSLVYGGYLFGNLPIIRDNLGIVLFVGLAAAAGPVLLAGALQLLRARRARTSSLRSGRAQVSGLRRSGGFFAK